jgi:hypothetical protein
MAGVVVSDQITFLIDISSMQIIVQSSSKFSQSPPFFEFMRSSSGSISSSWWGSIRGSTEIFNFLTISKVAALSCRRANRIPKHILGPSPKGISTPLSLKDFTPPCSASNLSGMNCSGLWKKSKTNSTLNCFQEASFD